MKLIIGLGNPGKQYEKTRHNAGFLVIDALIDQDRNELKKGKGPFQINRNPFQNGKAVVAKPAVFMNESGVAVRFLLEEFEASAKDCLVVVDDVDLPMGKIRFRQRGSAGGHHGLESIIQFLGTSNFPRLRIGVGISKLNRRYLADYVLGEFSKEEWDLLLPQIEKARDACLEWLQENVASIMQRYN